ncbi:flagellar hook capping protein [Thermincola ferriacetica]|uniref:Flagellar hook capping protein n=1 Tax=Thermincola ferriacetica TaxID=281456 RepID=A0A0L6W5X7_9FIRM|nr:flagellar hook capping FlgD N-terminal domain-containing protein [Thermincola ferriacetica]KNZ70881.1 flagellar hook capping protein [Thermincola ferriacetica]
MTTVNNVSDAGSTLNQEAVSRTVKNVLGKDDFLKLLLTQLKYQDPLEPTDNKDFIAQMAQFSALEQMTNMSDGFAKLAQFQETLFRESTISQAIGLIGKQVEATLPDQNEPLTGFVTAMKIVDGEPKVVVNGKEIGLGYISMVLGS